jgi:hypothetical protein
MGEDNDDNNEFSVTKRSLLFVLTSAFAPALLVIIGSIFVEIGGVLGFGAIIGVIGMICAPIYSLLWSRCFVHTTPWKYSSKVLVVLPIGFLLWWVNYLISIGACIAIDPPISVD